MQLLQNLLKIKYCKLDEDGELLKYFKELTDSLNVHNVFNPSFYCDSNITIFAFRAIPNGNDEFTSYVSIEDKSGHSVKNISIDLYKELNGVRLIDPKIFKINKEFYIAFNSGSGWLDKGNDIFIMKIYPEIESPKRLLYEHRKKQERNWAFFSEEGEIYTLYSINPLKILRLKNKDSQSWEMEDFYHGERQCGIPSKNFTIGTQLSKLDDAYYFIAHKKLYFGKKKIYLGKLCALDFKKKKILPGRYWLVHSLRSLFGSRVKHNTNLFSCTYFSGIQSLNTSMKLGYGVNDVQLGFSTHKLEDL